MRCGYLGCSEPATKALRSKYGRSWWYGCDGHHPAMFSAMFIGQPADSGEVLSEDLR